VPRLTSFGCDPGRRRGHTDLIAGTIVAEYRAGDMSAVTVVVTWNEGGIAHPGWVEPVVGVIELAVAEVAAVVVDEGRMGEVDARVQYPHDDVLASGVVLIPSLGCIDGVEVPVGGLDLGSGFDELRFRQPESLGQFHSDDLVVGHDPVQGGEVAFHEDDIGDPERGEL